MDYLSPEFKPERMQNISVLGLAHIGDAVYGLMTRTWLLEHGSLTSKGLHRSAVGLVNAAAQAGAAERIREMLTGEEREVFLRGRNVQVKSVPKNADRGDYQHATALEALFGYLYLRGDRDRLNELFSRAVSG